MEVRFEKENVSTFDGKGELLLTIMSSLAQEESRSISYLSTATSNIAKETGCSLPKHDDNAKYWPILFRGKNVQDKSQGSYCWKMRKRVINAIEMLIDEGVIDERALPEEERD